MKNNCVAFVIDQINDLQEALNRTCHYERYTNLLSTNYYVDTIPFILYLKNGEVFSAFGDPGMLDSNCSFQTPFFRIEKIHNKCVTLSLLRPILADDEDCTLSQLICKTKNLTKTKFCVEVDISCYSAIQCISPRLILKTR